MPRLRLLAKTIAIITLMALGCSTKKDDPPPGEDVQENAPQEPSFEAAVAHLKAHGAIFKGETADKLPYALDFTGIRDLKQEDLTYLKPLTSLRKLYLYHQDQIPSAGLAPVAHLVNLTEINLPGMKVSGVGMSYVGKLPRLDFLSLGNSDVNDADLVHLKGLKNLRFLTLYNTKIAGPGLAHLSELEDFSFLSLNGLKIDDGALVPLRTLKNLKNLDVSGTLITDRSFELFKQLPNLQRVDLDRTPLSAEGRQQVEESMRGRAKQSE